MALTFSSGSKFTIGLTILFTVFGEGSSLQCYQCNHFESFYDYPKLDSSLPCNDTSSFTNVTCDSDTHFCIKMQGTISENDANNHIPAGELPGLQRGCLNMSAVQFFTPTGNTYRPDGDCQTGDRIIRVPETSIYNSTYSTDYTLNYTFSGTYCLCSRDNCNGASPALVSLYVIIASIVLVQMY